MTHTSTKINLAIFASGTGSNTRKIIGHFKHHPEISVALIVCNKPGAGVLDIAQREKIPDLIIDKKRFPETGYVAELKAYHIDWIILAGFLWKVPEVLIHAYPNKIINIHPALLPSYGGKGMYGMAVHNAVVNAGEKQSGITIHFVDQEYDHGNIIFQQTVALSDGETPESLADKIHGLEYAHFAPTIEKTIIRK